MTSMKTAPWPVRRMRPCSSSRTIPTCAPTAARRSPSSATPCSQRKTARPGLRLLDANPSIRVLFTDIGLPGGMNGRQLSEEARKRRPDLKVLFTTGYARNAIVHDGRLDPGVELITKPFSQATLAEKLRDILDAKRVPGRILLVEDEVLIQLLATEYLEDAGFKVDAAGSATEAMNKIRLVPGGVDAVIIDVGLPDRQWRCACFRDARYLSFAPELCSPPARARPTCAEDSKAKTGMAFVTKPYTADNLLHALRQVGVTSSPIADGSEVRAKAPQ